MAKCLVRYSDPAGREPARMCGRLVGHKGNHASQGTDGSWALWTPAGDLVMAVGCAPAPPPEHVEPELPQEDS